MNRSQALKLLGGGALALSGLETLTRLPAIAAATPTGPPADPTGFSPLPLPFDPAGLPGLSARLMTSHHQNNYGGAVKRLGLIKQQLSALPADAAPFQAGALKREELTATNSILLHELYFEQFGAYKDPEGALLGALTAQYGSFEAWLQDFKRLALSLGGGSGWALLYHHPLLGRLETVTAPEHSVGLAGGQLVLALDMYEHAYHLDYGADAKAYVEAFFRNFDWRVMSRRYDQAQTLARLFTPRSAARQP